MGTTLEHMGSMLADVSVLSVNIDRRISRSYETAERGLAAAQISPSLQCYTIAGCSTAMETLSVELRL